MTKRLTVNNLVIHLVLVSIIAGCTTMQPVYGTDARSLARQIRVGDKIKIIRMATKVAARSTPCS
jgi:hypothetical protein